MSRSPRKLPPTTRQAQATPKTPPLWQKNIATWKTEEHDEPADNYFCLVCHVNYEEEQLVDIHRTAGVGCETCHGMSDKHSEDEDNITPPEIMFSKQSIMPFCMACHDKKTLLKVDDHKKILAPPTKSNASPSKIEPNKSCTECHGQKHRLKVRTRKWNKETGKLIWSDGVRMMETDDGVQ